MKGIRERVNEWVSLDDPERLRKRVKEWVETEEER